MKLLFKKQTTKLNFFNKSLTEFYEQTLYSEKIPKEKFQEENLDEPKPSTKSINNIIEEDIIRENENEIQEDKSPYKSKHTKTYSDTLLNENPNDKYLPKENQSEFRNSKIANEENAILNSEEKSFKQENFLCEKVSQNFNFQLGQKIKQININEEKYSIVICITIHSENFFTIEENLKGIFENLLALNKCGFPNERILIILISDGMDDVDSSVIDNLIGENIDEAKKFLDEKMEKNFFEEKYSKEKYVKNYSITFDLNVKENKEGENNKRNLDVKFCLKKNNCGRFDSHFWLIYGFNIPFNPKFVIFLNGGNIPSTNNSLANLLIPMLNDPYIGGTCGETNISNQYKFTNFVTNFQLLENKYNFAIDKHFDNLFGFVSSLPLSFSAYSNSCLTNNSQNMKQFFYSKYEAEQIKKIEDQNFIENSYNTKSISEGEILNRYLDYDKLLTFNLLSSEGKEYNFKYIPDATGNKIISENFSDTLMKYKNKINGFTFANFFYLRNFLRLFKTAHKFNLISFVFLFIFNFFSSLLNYFSIGTFYFFYYFVYMKMTDTIIPLKVGYLSRVSFWTTFFMNIYLFGIIIFIICCLFLKPKKINNDNNKNKNPLEKYKNTSSSDYNKFVEKIYFIFAICLSLFNFITYILAIVVIFSNKTIKTIDLNLSINTEKPIIINENEMIIESQADYNGAIFLFSISIIFHFFPIFYEPSMILIFLKNTLQYLLLIPFYSIQLKIFAFCNTDDLSNVKNSENEKHELSKFKFINLLIWLGLNFLQGWVFVFIITETSSGISLINAYSIIIGIVLTFRIFLAFLGKLKYIIFDKKIKKLLEYKEEEKANLKKVEKKIEVDLEDKSNKKIDFEDKSKIENEYSEVDNKKNMRKSNGIKISEESEKVKKEENNKYVGNEDKRKNNEIDKIAGDQLEGIIENDKEKVRKNVIDNDDINLDIDIIEEKKEINSEFDESEFDRD